MANSSIISSERLDLIPLTPAFLQASLQGESTTAKSLLGLSIPSEWFQEQRLMKLRLAQLQQNSALQPWLLRAIALRHQPLMVGHIGFHTQPGAEYLRELAPGGVEYGYTVFTSFRRQGYAREACEALMQWAYQEHDVTRFVVSIRPDNIPSRRLAERFGFNRIGSHIDEEDGLEDIYELRYCDLRCLRPGGGLTGPARDAYCVRAAESMAELTRQIVARCRPAKYAAGRKDLAAYHILKDQGGDNVLVCFHCQQAIEKHLKGFIRI